MSYLLTRLYSSGSYLYNIVQKVKPLFNSAKNCETPINEVLIYGDNDEGKSRQMGLNNLFCIYYVIIHASRCIDVCVPRLVNANLIKCILSVHKKNKVIIRIIVHNSKDLKSLEVLTGNGIEVRVIKGHERLEHDFILIDASEGSDDAVGVLGTIGCETSGVNCNRKATMLTSEAIVVKALKQEFDRVWCSVGEMNKSIECQPQYVHTQLDL